VLATHRDPHYLANMGKVLDTLRHDYPRMLTEAPQMDIYTKDVIFRERLTADLHGKDAYLAFFWGLRFHCWVLLRNAQMEIKSLFVDEDRSAIHVRWRLSGYLRLVNVNWVLDGLSIYRLNSEGLCYLHTLENTVPPQAWRNARPVFERIRAQSARRQGVGAACHVRSASTPPVAFCFDPPRLFLYDDPPAAAINFRSSACSQRSKQPLSRPHK